MSMAHYETHETDEYGNKSFYVTLTLSNAIMAEDEDDASERFQRLYLRQSALNGFGDPNGYGGLETKVIPGPPIYRRKKNAPVVCDKCRQDIDPDEFEIHQSGECKDRQDAAIKKMIEEGLFG